MQECKNASRHGLLDCLAFFAETYKTQKSRDALRHIIVLGTLLKPTKLKKAGMPLGILLFWDFAETYETQKSRDALRNIAVFRVC